MPNLKDKETLKKYMELSDRVLELIDEKANEQMSRGDLQGCVEAIIMSAMDYKQAEIKPRVIIEVKGGVVQMVYSDNKNIDVNVLDRDNQQEETDLHVIEAFADMETAKETMIQVY
jgi:hypothetical protein